MKAYNEPGKPERYKEKLEKEGCEVLGVHKGPVPNVVTLFVRWKGTP